MAEKTQRIIFCRRHTPEQILCVESPEALIGKLPVALGGVDDFTGELLELLHGHDDGLTVPVGGQQITGTVCREVDAVALIPLAGREKTIKRMVDHIASF